MVSRGGMKGAMTEEKRAVECGYWNLFRFDLVRRLKARILLLLTLRSQRQIITLISLSLRLVITDFHVLTLIVQRHSLKEIRKRLLKHT